MICADNLAFGYTEDALLFQAVSFCLQDGDCMVLMGRNGSGKSTLFRLILGLETPTKGKLTNTFSQVVPVFQEDRLFEHLSIEKNIKMPLHHLPKEEQERRTAEALALVGLTAERKKKIARCSGGMKRRCAFARAMALMEPGALLLLDEPLAGVDELYKKELLTAIKSLRNKQSVIMISHDEQDAKDLNASIYVIG